LRDTAWRRSPPMLSKLVKAADGSTLRLGLR
jgi:hypothetical protein